MSEQGTVLGQQAAWDGTLGGATRVPAGIQAAVHQADSALSNMYPAQTPSLAGLGTGKPHGTLPHEAL